MTAGTLRRTAATAAALGIAATLAAAPGAQAQSSTSAAVASGQTMLRLDAGTAKVLRQNKIRIGLISPAKKRKSGLTFPVAPKDSSLDPRTYAGTLNHTGGITFRARDKTLRLSNFRVTVGSSSSLNARINNGSRATIISLNTKRAKVTRGATTSGASEIVASLNRTGATALNRYFGVRLFKRGLKLGTIRSEAKLGEILFAGGQTDLALNTGTLRALTLLGVAPGIIAPATLADTLASFPITGGKVNAKTLAGSITHSGGISLALGGLRVALTDPDIQLPKMLVNVNGGKAAAALDLDTANAQTTISGRNVTVANVVVKINRAGSSALGGAFGIAVPEVTLGVATVRGQTR